MRETDEQGEDYQSTDDLSATPLKTYVAMVGSKRDNFGCKLEPYIGTYSRIRAHLMGLLPGQRKKRVVLCPMVSKDEREKMKEEEEEVKRLFGNNSRKSSLPSLPYCSIVL
ncbi:unnamed protein product [Ilex paraguariensis]|uniref:Uncharacterized protein n=1 Tax=Ilex paraguariensis TaxID=185542 RepID=A0ABC8QMF5_9AQUA